MKFPPGISDFYQNISLFKSPLKSLFLISTLLFFFGLSSCRKDESFSNERFQNRSLTIADAKNFFQANFSKEELTKAFNARQFKTVQRKMGGYVMEAPVPEWDAAALRDLSIGTNAVMVPLHIENAYVHISPKKMVRYGFLNYLMMYKDSSEKIVTEWVELKPAEKWIFSKTARKYSGDILVKDKEGKLKKIYSYEEGQRIAFNPGLHNRKQPNPNSIAKTSGDGEFECFITSTVSQFILPKMCGCELHTYEQIGNCKCDVKPKPGYTKTTLIQLEVDCFEIPVDEPFEPGSGGSSPGGGSNNSGDMGGGGSPGAGDYPPLNCNPDPDYQVPTVPPPPGTEYVLPCSETEIPVENIPDLPPVPWIDQTPAEMLIEWFNTDEDLQMHLNTYEMNYLTENADIADELLEYLMSESREVKEFGRWAVGYLVGNPAVSFETFKNQFIGTPEGQDGEYDTEYWDDPNLSFPQQSLPSWDNFESAFPKRSDQLYETPYQLYTSIGKKVIDQYNSDPARYQNTCALRVSKALNYSGINIPSGPDRYEGADGKYYFLSAKALLTWMKKTFGTPSGDNYLTSAQGGPYGQNFASHLSGKKGIYMMVPNYPGDNYFRASGHADLINSSVCDGKCFFNAKGGVHEIFIWELQ